MFDTKYFFNVGLPLWWRIITKLEERKGKNGNV
jgi:hypothetical protein